MVHHSPVTDSCERRRLPCGELNELWPAQPASHGAATSSPCRARSIIGEEQDFRSTNEPAIRKLRVLCRFITIQLPVLSDAMQGHFASARVKTNPNSQNCSRLEEDANA